MLRMLVVFLRFLLHAFYRRVEAVGLEHVPPAPTPTIFVLNHPNGLLDALAVLALAPRETTFLAKSTLFPIPVVGWFVRGIRCLPVYRREDAEDPKKNAETFRRAQELLSSGRTLALFPEGTSHSDPHLKRLKTGAARIALGARPGLDRLLIAPAGIYYDDKDTFRSSALIVYGEPIEVPNVPPGSRGEPSPSAVRELTAKIEAALHAITLNATAYEAHVAIERAARVLEQGPIAPAAGAASAPEGAPAAATATATATADDPSAPAGRPGLVAAFELRKRLAAGHTVLAGRDPARLAALERALVRYRRKLRALGLDSKAPLKAVTAFGTARAIARALLLFAIALPAGTIGALVHLVPYRLSGVLADRLAESSDVLGTYKVLAAMLLFPLVWLFVAAGAFFKLGLVAGIVALIAAPLLGWATVHLAEVIDELFDLVRALRLQLRRPDLLARLEDDRREIRDDLIALAAEVEAHDGGEAVATPDAVAGVAAVAAPDVGAEETAG